MRWALILGFPAAAFTASCGGDPPAADDDANPDDDTVAGDDDATVADDDATRADDDTTPAVLGPGDPLTLEGSVFVEGQQPGAYEVVDLALAAPHVLASGQGGLWVIDVSDPAQPTQVGSVTAPDLWRADRIARREDGWVVAISNPGNGDSEIALVDVTDPLAPSLAWQGLRPELLMDVAVAPDGSFLVCAGVEGLQHWVLDGPALSQEGSLAGLPDCSALDVRDGVAAVGLGTDGLALLDVTDPAAAAELGRLPLSGFVQRVAWGGERVLASLIGVGLASIDATDPGAPTVAGEWNEGWSVFGAAASDGVVFAAALEDLVAVEFGVSPRVRAVEAAPQYALGVAVDGDLVYVADWTQFDVYRFHPEEGGAEIEVRPRGSIYLTAVEEGGTEGEIEVSNHGSHRLEATLSPQAADLVVDPATLSLAEGESGRVALSWAGAGEGFSGAVRIDANDPDEPSVVLDVLFGAAGLQVGEVGEDFTLAALGGGTVTFSDLAAGGALLLYFFTTW